MFDFSIVTNWIHELLLSIMPEGLAIFIECVAVGVCLVALYAILAIILIYMERKVCGFFQCRLGPNRVGKWGSIQVVCDVLKMMTKEIFMPKGADHFLYTEPGMKGDTATNTLKPATVESGATVRVPLFISEGETIEIDTRDGSYVGRVKA